MVHFPTILNFHGSGALILLRCTHPDLGQSAAFLELHNRLTSLEEEKVQGSFEIGTSGVLTRVALVAHLVKDVKHDAQMLLARRVAVISRPLVVDVRSTKTGSAKVSIFLHSECSLFAKFLLFLESLDRETDLDDFQDFATSEDSHGWPADVTWMNRQVFNVLAQKTRGKPFQTVETCQGKMVLRCWSVGQTSACLQGQERRTQAGVGHSLSESITPSVCLCTQKYLPSCKCGKPG